MICEFILHVPPHGQAATSPMATARTPPSGVVAFCRVDRVPHPGDVGIKSRRQIDEIDRGDGEI
jgi:hypothetical protein